MGVEHQLRQHRVNFGKHIIARFAFKLTDEFLQRVKVKNPCKNKKEEVQGARLKHGDGFVGPVGCDELADLTKMQ